MTRTAATQPRPPEPPSEGGLPGRNADQLPVDSPVTGLARSREEKDAAAAGDPEALLAFTAETRPRPRPPVRPKERSRALKRTLIGMGALVLAGAAIAGVFYWAANRQSGIPATQTAPPALTHVGEGTATISSRPEGAQVLINGVLRGITPLKLSLPVGEHTLELQNGAAKRSLPLLIEAGTIASQYVDLAPGAATATGRLEVISEPSGARVSVDGTPRGVTPLVLAAINPGQHRVVIADGDATVTRTVTVAAGATATVVASIAPVGPSAGWVSFKSPLELQVLENGRLIGTSSADQLMLPAGRHDLELVNATYEFRTTLSVQVVAGRTATSTVAVPSGSLSINALPWADVWIDGRSFGATPLANLTVPIGSHEIVWRHPQLGERRQTVVVTARSPVRVGMDLRK